MSSKTLSKLDKETKKAQKKTKHVIWCLHFAPEIEYEPDQDISEKLILINGNELVRQAQLNKIKHIFCGHTHKDLEYSPKSGKGVKIYCNGTSSVYNKFNKDDTCFYMRKINVKDSGINIQSTRYLWKDEESIFIEEKP